MYVYNYLEKGSRREKGTQRNTETNRQTDRQAGRQASRQTDRQTDVTVIFRQKEGEPTRPETDRSNLVLVFKFKRTP